MTAIQLDLFNEVTEFDILKEQVDRNEDNVNKYRRSFFARHNDLAKRYMDLNDKVHSLEMRLQLMERNLK